MSAASSRALLDLAVVEFDGGYHRFLRPPRHPRQTVARTALTDGGRRDDVAATAIRRTIAPLAFILALSLVTGFVWYRVLHREPAVAKATAPATSCKTVATHPAVWPAPKTISLSVLNATDRSGLAGSVTTAMKQRGFATLKPGNAGGSTVTQIRYGAAYLTTARLVHYYLPGSMLVSNASRSPTIVVLVGSNYSALATPAQVAAAMKTAPAVRVC